MLMVTAVIIGVMPMTGVTAWAAQNGSEKVINASSLQEDAALVLERDTVLNMDVDRTLKSIQGSTYLLYLEGLGTLTVDSDECAIDVYSMTAEEGSNLTVICSDREEYCIQTKDTFTFAGANLNIDAYYGIKSDLGDIIIDASESATISTRKGYAVLVESNDKEYEVRGVEVTLLERKETLLASELDDHANIVLEDDTILVMDEEKTLGSISGAEYQLVIEGPNSLTFDTNRSAIYVQDLDVNTDLTVNSSCNNEYSIRVKNDINIKADNLIVDAVFGIKSDEGDIVIDVENHVEVYAEKGANIVSEGGAVYVYGQVIWIKNKMNGKDGVGREHGIYAGNSVQIIGSGVNNIVIVGTYGIESGTSIQLNGNFTIDSYLDGLRAQMGIDIEGYIAVESTRRLHYEKFFEEYVYGIYCKDGPISMKGSKLRVVAEYGIKANGNLTVNCEEIDVTATLRTGVTSSAGNVTLAADKIRITATFERFKEYQDESDIPGFFGNEWKYGRVVAGDRVQISSQDCEIKGPTPVFADASGKLSGDIRLFASGKEAGLKVFSGPLTLDGDIGIYVEVEDDHVNGIYAKQMKATGTGLYVTSTDGIYCMGAIDLNCDTISIQATAGDGIRTLNGGVLIDGGSLSIETAFDKEDLWDGGDCIGIKAIGGVRLDCASAEIYAPVGIQVSEGDVYLNGYSRIGSTEKGVYVDTGNIYINGYTRVGIQSGGDPLRSEKMRIIVDPSLSMNYPAGGKIQAGPGRVLDSEDQIPEYVEFGSYVTDVSFNIDTPVGHNLIYTSGRIVRDLPEGLQVKNITWYCDGEKMELKYDGMGSVYEYQAGKRYKAEVLLETDTQFLLGYGYNSDDTLKKPIVINGEEPHAVGYTKTGREIYVTYDFGTCPTGFYRVDLTINAPVDGNIPSKSVTAGNSGYGVRSENVQWLVSNDGVDYTTMNSGDKFIGGKYYKVIMEVTTPSPNYAFGWQSGPSGELLPRYWNYVYVNNANVEFSKIEGKDPLHCIEVSYDFGICNSSIIRKIEVVNVKEPRVGEHPNYEVSTRGTGYTIEQKNASKDIYWKNPPEEWYYIRNGVRWYDVTDGGLKDVYDQDTFILGHEYECVVYLTANVNDEYEFLFDNYKDEYVKATMNGQPAEIKMEGSNLQWYQEVSAVFSCDEYGSASFTVSGDVTSAGSELDDVTIELYTELSSEPVYETTARGNEAAYTIYDVTPGTYTMKVKKANHVTRGYEIVVASEDVEQDVKVHLKGDVTGDGNTNIFDLVKTNNHIKETTLLTGYEFNCVDITGDGAVNIFDLVKINNHIKETTLLW